MKAPVEDSQVLVQRALISLSGAFKKNLLYPPEHIIYQTSLESLKKDLDLFFNKHGDLGLEIERHQILYKDKVVHDGPMDEENPAFILFRDGIYHLEFKASIELWEIHSFIEILKKNKTLTEDAENDIVTALWELKLPNLDYKAEDVGFETGEDFEIPELGGDDASDEEPEQATENANAVEPVPFINPLIPQKHLWEITAEDREHLQNMLVEEEEWERVEYVLYILLFILQQQSQPDNFSKVMSFLKRELQEAMAEHKYQSVYNSFQILKNNRDLHKDDAHWSVPLLDDFFAQLSEAAFLNVLSGDWDHIADCPPEELAYLKRTLLLLNAEAIEPLAPMLLNVTSNQSKKLLMPVIGILAERNFEPFQKPLASAEEVPHQPLRPDLDDRRCLRCHHLPPYLPADLH